MQIREQEIAAADKEIEGGDALTPNPLPASSSIKKKTDGFFQEVDDEEAAQDEAGLSPKEVGHKTPSNPKAGGGSSKKIVGRDGRIGKSQSELMRDRKRKEEYEEQRNKQTMEKKWGL